MYLHIHVHGYVTFMYLYIHLQLLRLHVFIVSMLSYIYHTALSYDSPIPSVLQPRHDSATDVNVVHYSVSFMRHRTDVDVVTWF